MKKRCNNCFKIYDDTLGLCPFCGYSDGERAEEAFCLTPGTLISNRYLIGQKLNLGGFGIVYKAWDTKLNIEIAIKEYYPSGLVNRMPGENNVFLVAKKREREFVYGKTRFLEEARNMAKFSKHKNIVNVFDYFEANNTAYIVMEYLDGKTINDVIRQQNVPLPSDYCVNIAVDICEALRAIHKEGIIHRDVSPDNIMLCNNGMVKLFDFGAARFSANIESRVTIVVKRGYAPPEQYEQVNRQDARTDIYALGATLYYAMTGVKPEESTDRKTDDTLVEPSKIESSIPKSISSIIMKAMAVEPQYRFPNVDSFEKALVTAKKQKSVKAEKRKRKIIRAIGISASVLLILAAAMYFLIDMHRQKVENTLPDANITMIYELRNDSDPDNLKNALSEIINAFTDEYTNVTINAIGVESAEYSQTITRESKDKGVIFESTYVGDEELTDALALTDFISENNIGTYITRELSSNRRFPTGIVCPVIFIGQSEELYDTALSLEELMSLTIETDGAIVVSPEAYAMFTTVFGDVSEFYSPTAVDDFISGGARVLLGTSRDYPHIQDTLPGKYAIAVPESDNATYLYGQQWSAISKSADEERVEKEFLVYLNSALAQDYLHIQMQSGCLPILKEKEKDYCDVYEELTVLQDFLNHGFTAPEAIEIPNRSEVVDDPDEGDDENNKDDPESATPIDEVFEDVNADSWYADAVAYVYENGLMSGTTPNKFSPGQEITRSQLVTVLYKNEGSPEAPQASFPDINPGVWYEKAAGWASANKIVGGYADGRFGPDDAVPREQLAQIFYNYARYKDFDTSGRADLSNINDADQVSPYAEEAIRWAIYNNLFTPNGGKINPRGHSTRVECAVLIMRLCAGTEAQ